MLFALFGPVILATVAVAFPKSRGVLIAAMQQIRGNAVAKSAVADTAGVLNTISAGAASLIHYLTLEMSMSEWKTFPDPVMVAGNLADLLAILPKSREAMAILESLASVLTTEVAKSANSLIRWKHSYDALQKALAEIEPDITKIPDRLTKLARKISEITGLKRAARASDMRLLACAFTLAVLWGGEGSIFYKTWAVVTVDTSPEFTAWIAGTAACGTVAVLEFLTSLGLAPLYLRHYERIHSKARPRSSSASTLPSAKPIPLREQLRRLCSAEAAIVCVQVLANYGIAWLRREWVSESSETTYILASVITLLALSLAGHFCIAAVVFHYRAARQVRTQVAEKLHERKEIESELRLLGIQRQKARSLEARGEVLARSFKVARDKAQAELLANPRVRSSVRSVAQHLVRNETLASAPPVTASLAVTPAANAATRNGAAKKKTITP